MSHSPERRSSASKYQSGASVGIRSWWARLEAAPRPAGRDARRGGCAGGRAPPAPPAPGGASRDDVRRSSSSAEGADGFSQGSLSAGRLEGQADRLRARSPSVRHPIAPVVDASGRCEGRAARGSAATPAVTRIRPAARLLGGLLAHERAPDQRRAGDPQRLRRHAPRRRVDERQPRHGVAPVERQRGERAAEQVRRADAVARVAERRPGRQRRAGRRSPGGGWGRRRSARPTRAPSGARRAAGRSAAGRRGPAR